MVGVVPERFDQCLATAAARGGATDGHRSLHPHHARHRPSFQGAGGLATGSCWRMPMIRTGRPTAEKCLLSLVMIEARHAAKGQMVGNRRDHRVPAKTHPGPLRNFLICVRLEERVVAASAIPLSLDADLQTAHKASRALWRIPRARLSSTSSGDLDGGMATTSGRTALF